MMTKKCISCHEVLPIERFPLLSGGGRCDQCDAPYCQALRHAALTAVHGALILTFWPVPLIAIVIIALSLTVSPWLWWSVVPLAAWTAWKSRTIPDRAAQLYGQIPAELTERVDRLGYLRDLRTELLRANISITPGIERYVSGTWAYEDLSVNDRRTIDAADAALTERGTGPERRQEDNTITCG